MQAYLWDASRNTGDAAGDVYISIEGLIGSARGDILEGNGESNQLRGNAGHDRLKGLGGHDGLYGGAGDDTLLRAEQAGLARWRRGRSRGPLC